MATGLEIEEKVIPYTGIEPFIHFSIWQIMFKSNVPTIELYEYA